MASPLAPPWGHHYIIGRTKAVCESTSCVMKCWGLFLPLKYDIYTKIIPTGCFLMLWHNDAAFKWCREIRDSELESHSSNVAAFMCSEVVKPGHHGLYFHAFKQEVDAVSRLIVTAKCKGNRWNHEKIDDLTEFKPKKYHVSLRGVMRTSSSRGMGRKC